MKACISSFCLSLALLASCGIQCGVAQTIYENNFDQYTTERTYTDDDLDADWNEPIFNDGVTEGRVSIVGADEAYGGTGSALAVFYPAGEDGTKQTGAQWQLDFDNEYEEVILRYRVKFKSGFDFVRGGKLPGLAGGTSPTGNTQADGTNGWTGRMMWRTDFTGVSGNPEQLTSDAISYAKYTDSGFDGSGRDEDKEYWVDSDGSRTVLESGQWYEIIQRVKMNQPGERDGILQIWLDGNLVHDQNDVLFRTTDAFSIDQVYFSTFFGGNEDWRTSKDETVYFDDFEITVPGDSEPPREPRFIKVPDDYDAIQDAVDAALPGDTVAVTGRYRENVVVDKAIFIRGYTGTRITARSRNKPALRVTVDDVHVKRFSLLYGTEGVLVDPNLQNIKVEFVTAQRNTNAGICLKENCDGAWLSKNQVYNSSGDGITVDRCDDVEIVDNKCYWADGVGFSVFGSARNTIEGNIALRDNVGFLIDGSNHTVDDNLTFRNDTLSFQFSGDNHIVNDNYSRLNGSHGYSFINSSGNEVTDNVSSGDEGNGFEWTLVSDNNMVVDNLAKLSGGIGFYLDLSSGNTIDDALSLDNVSGFVLTGSTVGNTVKKSLASDNEEHGIFDQGTDNVLQQNTSRRNGNGN